ncbi:histidine kinase, partial [Bacteroides fragilis]|nr:histidine kinase [Bacteroides fragilis]
EKQRLEFEKSSTEQRAFIAREIHDVVTHSLSVIVAQADGALYTKDTEAQEEALKSISRVGRTSLREKQRLEFEKSSTEQRAFIAREIHDVVTHSLSVI